jgi:hypothetical protein
LLFVLLQACFQNISYLRSWVILRFFNFREIPKLVNGYPTSNQFTQNSWRRLIWVHLEWIFTAIKLHRGPLFGIIKCLKGKLSIGWDLNESMWRPFWLLPKDDVSNCLDNSTLNLLMSLMMIVLEDIMMLVDLPVASHVNLRC